MRRTVGTQKYNSGFTLIELCISLMIIGLLMTPAISAYNLYEKNRKIEQTNLAIDNAADEVGSYLSSYGRYPCPAPTDAVPGDVNYGYEDCTAASGILTPANGAGEEIMIGSVPFRTLNLNESVIHDGYTNRLTYAVTRQLTDANTYAANLGGISLVNELGASIITPPDSAHFVIVAHEGNNDGAITYMGNVIGTCAGGLAFDVENCNGDTTFLVSNLNNSYDDRVVYATSVGVTPWQYQDGNTQHIHLRIGGEDVITGEDGLVAATTLPNPATNPIGLDVKALAGVEAEEGIIQTQRSINISTGLPTLDTGAFVSAEICDETSPADCFSPRIFGGESGDIPAPGLKVPATNPGTYYGVVTTDIPMDTAEQGGNIICNQGILVGVENGQAVCSDEIVFACDAGEKLVGIDNVGSHRGKMICGNAPAPACAAIPAQNSFCGASRNLPGAADGTWSHIYSGTCHKISGFSAATASTYPTQASLQTYIDGLNNAARLPAEDCGPAVTNGLVRDAHYCDAGAWVTTGSNSPRFRQRGRYAGSGSFGGSSSGTNASNSGAAFNAVSPMAVDPNNSLGNHDCWCREDYRVRQVANCSGGAGFTLYVDRLQCPNTRQGNDGDWTNVWNSGTTLCGCAAGPYTEPGPTCAAHFGLPTNAVQGNTVLNKIRSCPGNVVTNGVPAVDISACTCPNQSNQIPVGSATVNCPVGHTNSFTFNDGVSGPRNYTDKSHVEHRVWNCPTGVGGQVTSNAEGGSYTTYTRDEACACTGDILPHNIGCPPAQQGSHIVQNVLNCSLSPPSYEITSTDYGPGSNTCTACVWTEPPTAKVGNDINQVAAPVGSTCNCNTSGSSMCKKANGDYWTGCQCRPAD